SKRSLVKIKIIPLKFYCRAAENYSIIAKLLFISTTSRKVFINSHSRYCVSSCKLSVNGSFKGNSVVGVGVTKCKIWSSAMGKIIREYSTIKRKHVNRYLVFHIRLPIVQMHSCLG